MAGQSLQDRLGRPSRFGRSSLADGLPSRRLDQRNLLAATLVAVLVWSSLRTRLPSSSMLLCTVELQTSFSPYGDPTEGVCSRTSAAAGVQRVCSCPPILAHAPHRAWTCVCLTLHPLFICHCRLRAWAAARSATMVVRKRPVHVPKHCTPRLRNPRCPRPTAARQRTGSTRRCAE